MKILIIAGTGPIGLALVDLLAGTENEVVVTSRKKHSDVGNIHYEQGSIRDNSFFNKVMKLNYWDVVVDFMTYETMEFNSFFPVILSNTRQYIFISSCRVFSPSNEIITEKTEMIDKVNKIPPNEYAFKKSVEEHLLRGASTNNWTIVRPYITFGQGRIQLGPWELTNWLSRAIEGKKIILPQKMETVCTTLTSADIVAEAIFKLLGVKGALGEDFNLALGITSTWNEVVELYVETVKEYGISLDICWQKDMRWSYEVMHNYFQLEFDRNTNRRFDCTKVLKTANMSIEVNSERDKLKFYLKNMIDSNEKIKKLVTEGRNFKYEAAADCACKERLDLRYLLRGSSGAKYIVWYVSFLLNKNKFY